MGEGRASRRCCAFLALRGREQSAGLARPGAAEGRAGAEQRSCLARGSSVSWAHTNKHTTAQPRAGPPSFFHRFRAAQPTRACITCHQVPWRFSSVPSAEDAQAGVAQPAAPAVRPATTETTSSSCPTLDPPRRPPITVRPNHDFFIPLHTWRADIVAGREIKRAMGARAGAIRIRS